MSLKTRWLAFIGRRLNPYTLAWAKSGRGPFSFVRHVGRKSGRTFETPLVVAQVPEGFVVELTYGAEVNWYRNVMASGGEIGHRGRLDRIASIEPIDWRDGIRAFSIGRRAVLRMLRRREFRLVRVDRGTA